MVERMVVGAGRGDLDERLVMGEELESWKDMREGPFCCRVNLASQPQYAVRVSHGWVDALS